MAQLRRPGVDLLGSISGGGFGGMCREACGSDRAPELERRWHSWLLKEEKSRMDSSVLC